MQRRTVEQIVDFVPVVPLLHTFVPQILDNSLPDVEQVIEVHKIMLDQVPQRPAWKRELLVACGHA